MAESEAALAQAGRRWTAGQLLQAWPVRLVGTVAAVILAIAGIVFDRFGRPAFPPWLRSFLREVDSLGPGDVPLLRWVESLPAGMLSLLVLVVLLVPSAGWAFLELPTRLDLGSGPAKGPREILRWVRDSILVVAAAAAVVALAQLPNEAGRALTVTTMSSSTSSTSTSTTTSSTVVVGLSPIAPAPGLQADATLTTSTTVASHQRARPSVRTPLRLLLAIPLIGILLKMLLLRRYAFAARAKHTPVSVDDLLETQRVDLEQLARSIADQPHHEPARIVRFVGRWGDGKSFILRRLETCLEQRSPGRQAVAYVDVWKHQAEPILHLAIFEEVLSTPSYLRTGGWLHFPLTLVPGRYLSGAVAKLSLKVRSGSGVELPVALPPLPWQRPLERLVARQRRRGNRTVIVLDEIDRAAPLMAQTAITLALRSLDLPGVVVVLSHVEEILRYKVFNPSVEPGLPDLGSTIDASLFVAQFEQVPAALGEAPANQSLQTWWPSEDPHSFAGQQPDRRQYLASIQERLHRGFEGTSPAARRALQRQFEERYLGQSPLIVSPLTIQDAASMPLTFPSLRPAAVRVAGLSPNPSLDQMSDVKAEVQRALEASPTEGASAGLLPPIRVLETELGTVLLAQESILQRSGVAGDPALLAACVLLALELATYRVSLLS